MKTIRKRVFETNSSSTHSICICTDEEFKSWGNNDIFWDRYKDKFITKEELLIQLRQEGEEGTDEELIEEAIKRHYDLDIDTLESWGEEYESDHTTYTTKLGEKLHILCYYGYDY